MKRTNKYLSLALAIIMALSLCVTAFAEEATGTITLTNSKNGQTYTLYKIFDATLANENEETGVFGNASYTVEDGTPWHTAAAAKTEWFVLEKADADTWYVSLKADANPTGEEIATWIKGVITTNNVTTEIATKTAATDGAEIKWESLPYGYYFIDSSIGSLCTITTTVPNASVVDKNSFPTLTKQVKEGADWADVASASIGDNVQFKLEVFTGNNTEGNGNGVDADFVITDILPPTMTYTAENFSATVDDETVTVDAQYNNETKTLVITIDEETLVNLKNKTIIITYFASLDANAKANTKYTNEAILEYSTYKTPKVDADVYTYMFDLVKIDGATKTELSNAEFKLYKSVDGNDEIPVVLENGVYRPAVGTETGVVIVAGNVDIIGLDKGTYYLEEIKAPDGYNALPSRQAIDMTNGSLIRSENAETGELEGGVVVENNIGSVLPSTGGVGTTMFYVLGSVMMIGAAILLVTKKKMANEQ